MSGRVELSQMLNWRVKILDPATNVPDDSGGENIQNLDNLECMEHNINLNDKINEVTKFFVDTIENFKNLENDSNIS
jgi:hypothetical protein